MIGSSCHPGKVRYNAEHVRAVPRAGPLLLNIGCGEDVTIRELAEIIANVVGFRGELRFDTSNPDGTPRKLLERLQTA